MKVQIILQVYRGYDPPEAPNGFTCERNGILWEYIGECSDWETAQTVAKMLSEKEGVFNVEVYNVKMWGGN